MVEFSFAQNLANSLLQQFKAEGKIGSDWKFAWNNRKSSYGLCSYNNKTIYLSVHYVQQATLADCEDTLRHEIAHIIAGCSAGHGPLWKKACRMVGARPVRCGKSYDMPSLYVGVCPVCKHTYKANRKLKNMSRRLCGKAGCPAYKNNNYVIWKVSQGQYN